MKQITCKIAVFGDWSYYIPVCSRMYVCIYFPCIKNNALIKSSRRDIFYGECRFKHRVTSRGTCKTCLQGGHPENSAWCPRTWFHGLLHSKVSGTW